MRTSWSLGAAAILLASCATAPPPELVDARAAVQHASAGPAATLAPEELKNARDQLAEAEHAFAVNPGTRAVRDLAYAAHRQALAATAAAGAESARRDKATAEAQIAAAAEHAVSAEERARALQAQAEVQADREKQLREADALKSELRVQDVRAEAERKQAEEAAARSRAEAEAQAERSARLRAEAESAAAMRRLEQAATVREEARGRVITLSGSVIFSTGTATILPTARQRLDDVATALAHEPKATFTVDGYTDSRGAESTNLKLSRARATAVRDYLVERGVDPDRIRAIGKGEESPIATNATPEGRANNRRVEIIINRRSAQR
jgi:outer membrane protein OmpA-like peptidoglycan-associated protein